MRTTVTLDDDVVHELQIRVKQTSKSFKQILNESLRLAFSMSRSSAPKMKPFKVRTHRSQFCQGVDPTKLNQLLDQLDVEKSLTSFQKDLSKVKGK